MKLLNKSIPIMILIILSLISNSYSYTGNTHFSLNRFILENPDFEPDINNFLKSYLGFDMGLNTIINYPDLPKMLKDNDENGVITPEIWRWIAIGGFNEDEPWLIYPYRGFRHFHNPLKPWTSAGFAGTWMSSVLWAQNTEQVLGKYSWHDVRSYYYNALTSLNDEDRNKYFGETFRGIGQLMHLIEDASVPLHARDDAHVIPLNYETFIERTRYDKKIGNSF